MTHDPNCLFCRIVRGEIPAVQVFEDEDTIAFMDIFPASEGHALVIPKLHAVNLLEMPYDALTAVHRSARRLAAAMMRGLGPAGFQIRQFNGAEAGQTVFHYHVHVVLCYPGARPGLHGRDQADPAVLAGLAGRIRAAL